MRFVEFLPKHLAFLRPVEEEKGFDSDAMGRKLMDSGPCLTLVDGDTILACGGLVLVDEGIAEIWVRMSQKCGPHAVRELKVQMYRWIEEYKLERLQATSPIDWEANVRFLKWLGMREERTLVRFSWRRKWQ